MHAHAPIYAVPIVPAPDPETGLTSSDFYRVCDHHLITLMDMTGYSKGSALGRASRVEQLERLRPYLLRWVVGAAIVAPDEATRGTVTAIKWRFDFPYPVVVFDTLEQGLAWGRDRLAAEAHPPSQL